MNKINIIFAILNIFFGISFIIISYLMVDKPLCSGGTMPLIFPILFGSIGLINISIGVYRIFS